MIELKCVSGWRFRMRDVEIKSNQGTNVLKYLRKTSAYLYCIKIIFKIKCYGFKKYLKFNMLNNFTYFINCFKNLTITDHLYLFKKFSHFEANITFSKTTKIVRYYTKVSSSIKFIAFVKYYTKLTFDMRLWYDWQLFFFETKLKSVKKESIFGYKHLKVVSIAIINL